MDQLYPYIGIDSDVPAGDIGVGGREITYMYDEYKRKSGKDDGALTGKSLKDGGSILRPEATGYGLCYYTEALLKDQFKTSFKGKRVLISGSGNVATFACEKAQQLGAKVLTMSDSSSAIYDPEGIDLKAVRAIKEGHRGRIHETSNYFRCLPNDNLLYFVLAKKVILVEGPSETLYLEKFYEKMFPGHTFDKDKITVIPVNGLAFERFVSVAGVLKKRLALITDNDANPHKKSDLDTGFHAIYNDTSSFQIFMENDTAKRTFEVCLFEANEDLISSKLKLIDGAEYKNDYAKDNRYLGKMLNEKTGTALTLSQDPDFVTRVSIPAYLSDALNFIHND